MKKALISPNEAPIKYISGYTEATADTPSEPIWSDVPNSCRVAQIEDTVFEVADPLFWTDVSDELATQYIYYDTVDQVCKLVPVDVAPPTT